MPHHLIIGNGIAANSAAARIRNLEPDSSITMVTDEAEPYYSRCALMYYVMDHCSKRDIYLFEGKHDQDLAAQLVSDRVVSVDAAASTVELEDRGKMSYDALLIASGAIGRRLGVPGEDAEGISNFNTLPDADYVLERLKTAHRGVVIGGGLIGAEVAEVFHELGVQTDYLVREQYFYPIFCSPSQSLIIQRHFEDHGVRMHMGRNVDHFEVGADGAVSACVDDRGDRYQCDVAVRAIGVEPNIGFLEGSGVETGAGVTVDEYLHTNVGNVWAAGDCAEIHLPGQERPMIQKLWYTAQPQGWVAGENMAGGKAIYDPGPLYQSAMFMALDFTSYGEMPAPWNSYEEESIDSDSGVDSLRLVHDGETVVGASFLGTAMTKEDIESMVVDRVALSEAADWARGVLSRSRCYNRAPVSRLDVRRNWSRRPRLWPSWLGGRS